MASGAKYQVKDKYTFLDEEMMNVYYFEQDEGDGKAEDMANAFNAVILPLILPIQHGACVHTEIEVVNWPDEEDFFTLVLTGSNTGEGTGETLPRFNAWGFRKNRASRAHRNGSIRIGGLAEGFQDGGVPTAGALTDLQALAAQLSSTLDDGAGNTYDLRIPLGPFVSPGFPSPGVIASVQFVGITTQNSRKR